MEPIEASLASASTLDVNPFVNAESIFLFGNGNSLPTENSQTPTSDTNATAATSQGANSPATATTSAPTGNGAAASPGLSLDDIASGSSSILTWITLGLLALIAFKMFHK